EYVPPLLQASLDEEDAMAENSRFAVYENMHRENPDFAGYLNIEGTKIDNPVMYSPEDPEKYLERDINDKKSSSGLPFIDAACSPEPASDNIIIYGHNMKNGTMFGTLTDYEDKNYYMAHPVIRFDTLKEERMYDIIYAFYDRVYYEDEKDFRFYDFIDYADEDDFNRTMDEFKDKSIYDTGVEAHYGDKFITLVTCSYQEENGRFVVMGVLRGDGLDTARADHWTEETEGAGGTEGAEGTEGTEGAKGTE
nr:class B sortase [Lachnospiraceae bacterium]